MAHARTKRASLASSNSAQRLVRTRPKRQPKSRKRPYPLKLAEKLIRLRLNLGLSQAQIAAQIGVKDRASISGYERGEREPPLPVLLAYARLSKIPMEMLVDDELDLPRDGR
jgi:DNA-binding XRE family transcriptional regulator